MNRKTVVALSLLAVLTFAGICKGSATGAGAAEPETITYKAKNADAPIGTAENPFTVLEIVPNENMAAVGYLIPGCEPGDISTDTGAMANYRSIYGDYDATTGKYGSDGVATVNTTIHNVFKLDFPSGLGYGASDDNKVSNDDITTLHFGQYGYFEHVEDGQGEYQYVAENGGYFTEAENGGNYHWVALIDYQQTENNIEPTESIGKYFLKGDIYTNESLDNTDSDKAYYTFEGGGSDKPFYGVPCISDWESKMPENNQDLMLQKKKIGTNEDIVSSRYYQDRYEESYYCYTEYGISHKNQLIQTLFPTCGKPEEFVSQVVTVTPEQLTGKNVTDESNIIKDADMIVIHDSDVAVSLKTDETLKDEDTSFLKHDIEEDCYNALIQRQASGNPAMMLLDESAMDDCKTNESLGKHSRNHIEKLYTVLNKFGAKYFYNVYCDSQETDVDGNPLWKQEQEPDETALTYTGHTTGGVYLGKAGYVLNFSDDDFLKKSVSDTATLSDDTGVKVLDAISEMYQKAHPNTTVNATEEDAATKIKTEINILEIEPIAQFIYGSEGWRSYFLQMMPDDFVGTSSNIEDDIHVTTMATYEFNGKIEDLNATYDMILIGVAQDETNGKNGYNDSALGNLAYTTVGDLIDTYEGMVNFIASDRNMWVSKTTNRWNRGKASTGNDRGFTLMSSQGSDIKQANIRYSSTDITEKKYEEIVAFSQMSPVIIDEDLYNDVAINTDEIDTSSFIYELADAGIHTSDQYHIERRSNVLNRTETEKTVKSLLTAERCYMEFSDADGMGGENGKPVEYEAVYQDKKVTWNGGSETLRASKDEGVISSVSNNDQTDNNNNNVLQYHFTLRGTAGKTYGVKLYIDGNGNGSFEASECSQNLQIDGEKDALGNLIPGKSYLLTRLLQSSESGIMPWKLEVYDVENPDVRDTETGYTRVVNGQKEKIRVLQMNLSSDMSRNNETGIRLDDPTSGEGAKFRAYLDAVEDYDVSIEFMDNKYFWNYYEGKLDEYKDDAAYETRIAQAKETWAEDLQNYDMLVLGFDDGFDNASEQDDGATFTDNVIFIYGFEKFVEAGKSVILSHDMVRDRSFSYPVGEGANVLGELGGEASNLAEILYENAWKVDQTTSAYLRRLSGQINVYYSRESIDEETGTVTGSTEYTYRNGEKISVLPDTGLLVGYLPNRGWTSLEIDTDNYLHYSDYVNWIAGHQVSNLMDNSVRALAFAAGAVGSDTKTDRTILDADGNTMDASQQAWTDTCTTSTVKVANQGQITTYPYAISDTIDVGATHAQNYKLNLDRDFGGDGEVNFVIDGQYDDWEGVPAQEPVCYPGCAANQGSLVYQDGEAWGHIVTQSGNYTAWTAMQFTIQNEDGSKSATVNSSTYYPIDEDGNITYTQNDLYNSFEVGETRYYCFGYLSKTTNIYDVYQDAYNKEAIFGLMKVTHGKDQDEIEYSLNIPGILEKAKEWGSEVPTIEEIAEVQTWSYGIGGPENPFTSNFTKSYVENLRSDTSDAIVWYNLSNDEDDATNIYAAKEGDSANNYYIYTKGNVTYTGMGHSAPFKSADNPAITNKEIRLFVNTLISAYRPTQQTPYLVCENDDALQNADVYTIYAEELEGKVTGDVEVKLRAVDDSITQTQKTYTVTVMDEDGERVSVYDNYKFKVAADVLNDKKKKTYTATLKTTYSDGRQVEDAITIRVMTMPLFGLD